MRDSCLEKTGRRAGGWPEGKFRRCRSLYHMKITVNLADLTSEQVKFLSQLGEFRGDQTWEAACGPDEFHEAVELLRRAGVDDLFVQFRE